MPSEIARLTDRLLSEVAAREPLPPEEEARLARLIADGKDARARLAETRIPPAERRRLEEAARQGREALAALVEHNLPFVVRMAGRYRWSGVPVIDLFQEGVLGLLRPAERYDWTRGTPFGAYASWWVRHAMSRAVRDATLSVRLPGHLHASLGRLAAERRADPSASWDVLAERSGVDEHLRRGFAYGTFEGTVMLPAGIDAGQVSARYDAGILEIRVPHAAVQEVKIPVEAGSGATKALKAAS